MKNPPLKVAVIPTRFIQANPNQPREEFVPSEMNELIESIRTTGQQEPITVIPITKADHPVQYELVSGERRWRACNVIGHDIISFIRPPFENPDERLLVELTLNCNRADHTPLEEMRAIFRLVDSGYSAEDIAASLGKSIGWVYQRMSLKKLHPRIQNLLSASLPKDHRITITDAQNLTTLTQKEQLAVLKQSRDSLDESTLKITPRQSLTTATRHWMQGKPDVAARIQKSVTGVGGEKLALRVAANLDKQLSYLISLATSFEKLSPQDKKAIHDLLKRRSLLSEAFTSLEDLIKNPGPRPQGIGGMYD